jgi:hypothetical protein
MSKPMPVVVNVQAPAMRGQSFDPKQALYARAMVSGAINTHPSPPAFNPRAYAAQSPNTLQYAPAYLYDWLPLGAGGVASSSYTFFQRAAGQAGVSYEDTNMQQPGQLGAGNIFHVQDIWVGLRLGVDYVSTGTDAAVSGANALDDYKAIMNRGYLQFWVNNSPQLGTGIAPLLLAAAPPQISAGGAVATGNAAALQALAPVAVNSGYSSTWQPFRLNDQLNFNATINFYGTPPTLPSANATTYIGVIMRGLYARPAG